MKAVTEQELQEKAKAKRVTLEHVQSCIVSTEFKVFGLLTVCVLNLQNGFQVLGQSACASPENYNQDIGERLAKEDAVNKIWVLEGYLLKQQLFEASLV